MEHRAWDDIWERTGFPEVRRRFFRKLCEYVKPGLILDVGCGKAQTDVALAKVVTQAFMVGSDFSYSALKVAKQRCKQKGVSINLVRCDVCYLPFRNDVFDVIFSEEVLEHVHEVEVMLTEVRRVLKAGASFIISVPNGISPFYAIWRRLLTFKGKWIYGSEHAYTSWNVRQLLRNHSFTFRDLFYFEMPRFLKFLDFYRNPLCVRIGMVSIRNT